MRRSGVVALGLAGAALIVAGWPGPVTAHRRAAVARSPLVRDPTQPLPGFPAPVHPSLAADVPVLEEFVAQTRDMPFLRPVTVEQRSQASFDKAAGNGPDYPAPGHDVGALYQTLGIVDSGSFYDSADDDPTDVDGLYLYGRDLVLLRDGPDTPSLRAVLVHELTHALDDQHFSCRRSAGVPLPRPTAGSASSAWKRGTQRGSATSMSVTSTSRRRRSMTRSRRRPGRRPNGPPTPSGAPTAGRWDTRPIPRPAARTCCRTWPTFPTTTARPTSRTWPMTRASRSSTVPSRTRRRTAPPS